MPNTGGTNGIVQSAGTSLTAGNFAVVHFDGPPPKNETYNDLTQVQLMVLLGALPKVDVTCDAAGAVTGVTGHR